MCRTRLAATDIAVEGFDAVDEAVRKQEIERAIDGGRRRTVMFASEPGQDVISPDRAVALPDELQHTPTQCGESQATSLAQPFGRVQRILDAAFVVVAPTVEVGAHLARHGSLVDRSRIVTLYRCVRSHNLVLALVAVALALPAHAAEVVATLKPIHSLTAMVMGDMAAPALMIDGAADPHNYAFHPSDAKMLRDAKLVVRVGPKFETFLNGPLRTLASSATVLSLADVPGMALPDGDEHLWLDPANAALALEAIGRALAGVYPSRAAEYTRSAALAKNRVVQLDADLRAALSPVVDKPFVVYHDAFRGFAAHYRLRLLGALVSGTEHVARARTLTNLAATAKSAGAACVFTEPQFSPTEAQALAREAGASLAGLDDLGADVPAGPEMYFILMRRIAMTLTGCLAAKQ